MLIIYIYIYMQLNILLMTIQLIFISTLTPLNFLAFYKEKIVFCGFLTLQWNTGHADLENLCVVELKEILMSSVVFMHIQLWFYGNT